MSRTAATSASALISLAALTFLFFSLVQLFNRKPAKSLSVSLASQLTRHCLALEYSNLEKC